METKENKIREEIPTIQLTCKYVLIKYTGAIIQTDDEGFAVTILDSIEDEVMTALTRDTNTYKVVFSDGVYI